MRTVSETAARARVEQALELAPIVDGHNDWAWESRLLRASSVEGLEGPVDGDTDILRLRAGRLGAQFWSVFVEEEQPGPAAGGRGPSFGAFLSRTSRPVPPLSRRRSSRSTGCIASSPATPATSCS